MARGTIGAFRGSGWGCTAAVLAIFAAPSLEARAKASPAPAPVRSAPADNGQWIMPARNYASTRYSGLSQITPANIANLRVEFTFSTGVSRGTRPLR